MTTDVETEPTPPVQPASGRRLLGRVWSVLLGLWGAVTGAAPHVLHHVGPLAGTALVAGAGGRLLFGAVGLVAAIPFLFRLYRRFRTWAAPAIALGVFALMFSLSTFVIGPLLTGERASDVSPAPGSTAEPADPEDEHHP